MDARQESSLVHEEYFLGGGFKADAQHGI
ncbi:MAG: hypothetical protein QOG58_2857, partial [Caballeronia sp.]|nr:hypothetical protein [Caballeronia sp.]